MRIAFLGPRGTYSEQAALQVGGEVGDYTEGRNFREAVDAVENGLCDFAVVPVENAIEGPVSASMDILVNDTELRLCGEVVVPIDHVLVGVPGADLAQVTAVTSHPQALAQCRAFLERELPNAEQVAFMSTSGAVQDVVEGSDPTRVAIGPARSQALYGGEILRRDIQDVANNMTRFFVLGREDAAPTGDDKTFIAFRTDKNLPGSLYHALSPFAEAGVQLTNIITRPTKGWLGEYVFLIDFEGHRSEERIATALEALAQTAQWLKIVGSCPRFPVETLHLTKDATT